MLGFLFLESNLKSQTVYLFKAFRLQQPLHHIKVLKIQVNPVHLA